MATVPPMKLEMPAVNKARPVLPLSVIWKPSMHATMLLACGIFIVIALTLSPYCAP